MTPAELKSWRQSLGLSQKAAAEALGVSLRSYGYYESGQFLIPRTVELAAAAVAAGLDGKLSDTGGKVTRG